jgi:FdhD protein
MSKVGYLEVSVDKMVGSRCAQAADFVAIEEPLEIRLDYLADGRRAARSISITMRTPGDDESLAVGFLGSEGIVRAAGDVRRVQACGPAVGPLQLHNVVRVELADHVVVDIARLERHFYTTSSCGVCGKTSLEALSVQGAPVIAEDRPRIAAEAVHALPERLRTAQAVFARTGGLHAAALFNEAGEIKSVREDVGRHNAVDKLLGAALMEGRVPLSDCGLLVSGRASFELAQKALMAGVPVLAAVGAPSSLAVELAVQYRMTLIGFLRDGRFNIYSGKWRLVSGT